MVIFNNTDYTNAMDSPMSVGKVSVKEFGVSSRMGDVLQGLKGDINAGASHVELGFTGVGKGSLGQGNTTPEMFGKLKREEVRQLAKINGVTLSTHASLGISGVAGLTQQGFSDKAQKDTLIELKRTIDFAADTARGGAIVVHTNEFPRNVKDTNFRIEDKKENETVNLADRETGKIFQMPKNQAFHVPHWKKDKDDNYIDANGKPIEDFRNLGERVIDEKKEGFVALKYADFEDEVNKWNKKHPEQKLNPQKEFLFLNENQKLLAEKPRIMEYYDRSKVLQKQHEKMKDEVEAWKQLEKNVKMDRLIPEFERKYGRIIEEQGMETKDVGKEGNMPSQLLEKYSNKLKTEAGHLREGYMGFKQHEEEIKRVYDKVDDIEVIGIERSAKNLASAAMYAREVEKREKLDKPLQICPENMFAEWGYGGHPDELRTIVVRSRAEMVTMLKQQKVSEKDAIKIAEDHIKATFDVGHANTWSRYFQGDKKEFDKWLVKEVDKLISDGIIGHVHISDNFGYHDEHLSPGQGNAPIEQFMKSLKDKKYEGKIIVEWGAQGDDEKGGAMLDAWANLANSPIYRVEGHAPTWRDIEDVGYFGTSSSPFHVTGAYGGSLGKDWKLWSYSEAPIE